MFWGARRRAKCAFVARSAGEAVFTLAAFASDLCAAVTIIAVTAGNRSAGNLQPSSELSVALMARADRRAIPTAGEQIGEQPVGLFALKFGENRIAQNGIRVDAIRRR
jgi:hypothetical protein